MKICHDVAQGLNWLGSHKIVHRDLKLDNLLVTEDWAVKITFASFTFSVSHSSAVILDFPSKTMKALYLTVSEEM